MWTLVDGEININLQKMLKAEAWNCALIGKAGETIDAFTQEAVKKQLMIERFQEEVMNISFFIIYYISIKFNIFFILNRIQLLIFQVLNLMAMYLMPENLWVVLNIVDL
jgi:hypothetical protein